jgi:hypothetical protein
VAVVHWSGTHLPFWQTFRTIDDWTYAVVPSGEQVSGSALAVLTTIEI